MKNIFLSLLLGFVSFSFGQRHEQTERQPKMSAEQRTQIMVKKMTLDLDLNSDQQQSISKIMSEVGDKMEKARATRDANRAAHKKPTDEEVFAMKNQILDEKIAMKQKLKTILTPQQLEKWEKMQAERQENRQERREKRPRD